MTNTDSFMARMRKAAAWLKEKMAYATAPVPEFNRLKSEVQDSERNLASFDFDDLTDAHSLSKNIEDYVTLRGTHIHLLGCLEGNLNVNLDGIDARIRAYAYSLQNIVVHHCRLLEVKVKSEIAEIDTVSKKRVAELTTSEQELRELDATLKQHPSSFSKPMGWFYTIASIILLVADLPLSLLAMQKLVPTLDDKSNWIAGHWGWAQLIIGLGITCIPFFVKIYFDKYIIHHGRLRGQQPVENDTEKWRRRIRMIPEFLTNSLIILFIALNLLILGYARHYFIEQSNVVATEEGFDTPAANTPQLAGSESSSGNGALDFSNLLTGPKQETVQFLALLFLSVLFPLLSGIMLAYGLFFLKNSRAIQATTARITKLSEEVTSLAKDRVRKQGEVSVIEGRILQWTNSGEGSLTHLYYLNFIEAYKRGFVLYNGNSSSRYHIMYRKYLRHFAIADFAKPTFVMLAVSMLLGGCATQEKVESVTSNASTSMSSRSADIKVLCDFTKNTTCFKDNPHYSTDTLPKVLKHSQVILAKCFNANQADNQAMFYAVLRTDGADALAKFAYPTLPPGVMNRHRRILLGNMHAAYHSLAAQASLYLRDAARSTCLVNSIVRLYPDVQAQIAANKTLHRSVKIVLLSDRLEECRGIRLETQPSAKQAIAVFDKTFRDVPNFEKLGVEFVFVTIGCIQPNEKMAADKFWQHVMVRFGYAPAVAKRMTAALTEVPADLFPSSN